MLPSTILRVGRQEADERERRRRLAAAGLAGDPERLATLQAEADAVDRVDGLGSEARSASGGPRPRAAARTDPPASAAPRSVRRGHERARRRLGLRRSSRAPADEREGEDDEDDAEPGRARSTTRPRGRARRPARAASRSWPHDGWNGSPRPDERQRRLGQDRAGERRARRWRRSGSGRSAGCGVRMMWPLPAPMTRARSTKARSRSDRVWRPDDPGGRRPARDPDDDDDDDERHPDAEDLARRRTPRGPG